MLHMVDTKSQKEIKRIQKGSYDAWGRDILKQAHRAFKITPADKDSRLIVGRGAEGGIGLGRRDVIEGGLPLGIHPQQYF